MANVSFAPCDQIEKPHTSAAGQPGKLDGGAILTDSKSNDIVHSMKDWRETGHLPGLAICAPEKQAKDSSDPTGSGGAAKGDATAKGGAATDAVVHTNPTTGNGTDVRPHPATDGGESKIPNNRDSTAEKIFGEVQKQLDKMDLDPHTRKIAEDLKSALLHKDKQALLDLVKRESKDPEAFRKGVWALNYALFKTGATDVPMNVADDGSLVLAGWVIHPDGKVSH